MKFERDIYREVLKLISWGVTPRRLSAAKRALQKQRDKMPLFAAEIAAGQPTPEARIAYYDRIKRDWLRKNRQYKANQWRKSRRILNSMTRDDRIDALTYWNTWSGPKTPEYLLDLLHNWSGNRGMSD